MVMVEMVKVEVRMEVRLEVRMEEVIEMIETSAVTVVVMMADLLKMVGVGLDW